MGSDGLAPVDLPKRRDKSARVHADITVPGAGRTVSTASRGAHNETFSCPPTRADLPVGWRLLLPES
ncbi:hypothetical protein GCM10020229_24450 [Kitasatospora albolonga]